MILLSSHHAFNAWSDEWSIFSGLTPEYWFTYFPHEVHHTIAENDNGYCP